MLESKDKNFIESPVKDFIEDYTQSNKVRLHMPGHKGAFGYDGDITEVTGADSLYEASGIIAESESRATKLFGAWRTFYGTEGSSQMIKAMCYLAVKNYYLKNSGEKARPVILATRNAHKSFIYASMLLDFDIKWILPERKTYSLCRCDILPEELEDELKQESDSKVVAVYITSPDYLGNILDIKGLAEIAHKYDLPLLVDNAHGAYLKLMLDSEGNDLHPITLGADLVSDSAHKTLPVLTGGAYLHLREELFSEETVRKALLMFGSTSPSYKILESLDQALTRINREEYQETVKRVDSLKKDISSMGYSLYGDEPLKLTIDFSESNAEGLSILSILSKEGIECEYADPEYLVTMWSPYNEYPGDFDRFSEIMERLVTQVLPSQELRKKGHAFEISFGLPEVRYQPYEIMYLSHHTERVSDKLIGKVAADTMVGCPPAVAPVVAGEVIDENVLKVLKHYNIENIEVID